MGANGTSGVAGKPVAGVGAGGVDSGPSGTERLNDVLRKLLAQPDAGAYYIRFVEDVGGWRDGQLNTVGNKVLEKDLFGLEIVKRSGHWYAEDSTIATLNKDQL